MLDWMADLKPMLDASSLSAALAAAVLGTTLLVLLRLRRRERSSSSFTWQKFLASFASTATPREAPAEKPRRERRAARGREAVAPESSPAPDLIPAALECPPELSVRIDRLEAKVRARSARRSG